MDAGLEIGVQWIGMRRTMRTSVVLVTIDGLWIVDE